MHFSIENFSKVFFVLSIFWHLKATETKVFPVFNQSERNFRTDNETLEVIVRSEYNVPDMNGKEKFLLNGDGESWTENEDVLLVSEREACWTSGTIGPCWRYKTLRFIQYLMRPMGVPMIRNFSTARTFEEPQLIAMPHPSSKATVNILGRAGTSGMGEIYGFLERQFVRFLSRHGVVFTAVTHGDQSTFEQPILLGDNFLSEAENGRSTQQRKVKRKSILFPLLVLFKFFKIKMVLLPILLTVLLIKKLLIVALALAPNVIGLFRLCRPVTPSGFNPPFGLASAGLLQDIGDSRGEFSTFYNSYASPYRDQQGYRTRQFGRLNPNAASPEKDEQPPDY